ncbi:zinc transporter 10 [Protopterus annectens]|uniref:zinc transporter 10 n=1 Tax=Protopterus annectens TaxID=7888 RepID=UPI001CFBB89A|nr:zinc transporter 10 [Protopterus annectens]
MGRYSGKTCRLIFMLVITSVFMVAELISGYVGNSIALVSDSFNMLSDTISLCVGITANVVSRRQVNGPHVTYGYRRAEVVGALSNAVFLTALCFTIFVEAVKRLIDPQKISDPELILIVGGLGLLINIIGLLIFQDYSCCTKSHLEEPVEGKDGEAGDTLTADPDDVLAKKKPAKNSQALNIRGVLLHVLGDALGSVVVVVAATIFYILPGEGDCDWRCYVDPGLTIIMVIIILSSAFPLIKETARILLQMVPGGVQVEKLGEKLTGISGVNSIHDLHIWQLSEGRNIATLHVKCQDSSVFELASDEIRTVFHSIGIHAVTIQPEFVKDKDNVLSCNSPCISEECKPHLCCNQQHGPVAESNGYDSSLSPTGIVIAGHTTGKMEIAKNADECNGKVNLYEDVKADEKGYESDHTKHELFRTLSTHL